MIKFYSQTLDGEVNIQFHHTNEAVKGYGGAGTDCELIINQHDGSRLESQSSTFCHPKDTFSKITGRKVALAKAMKNVPLTKEQRTEIWHKLFTVVNR